MEKVSLPIKTKIAAWWILVIGIFGLITSIVSGLPDTIIFLFLPSLFLFCLPSFFLLKRKKWAWWFSIITQFILIIFLLMPRGMGRLVGILKMLFVLFGQMLFTFFPSPVELRLRVAYGFPILLILLAPSFFLLLFDRKNFWKIAS
jgi:hypothetical protein